MMVMMKHRVSGGQADGELTVLTAARELPSCRLVRRRRRKSLQQAASVGVADQVSLYRRLSLFRSHISDRMVSLGLDGW